MKSLSNKTLQKTLHTTTTLLLGSAISGSVFAAGFALNEQSASGLGQAFAGRASDAIDGSTVFGNPGGMSRLKTAEISGGLSVIKASTDITNASGFPPTGSNDGDMVPTVTIPFLYYVQPLDEHWSAGFGLYSPFGLVTDYESGFEGRYFGTKSEVKMITAQPTVSYRFDEHWSLGGGITYNHIDGELSKDIPLGATTRAKVEGDDVGWGYNIGLLFELNDKTRAGVTYHSKVDYTLEGHTQISNFPGLGSPRYKASLDLTLPDVLDLSVTHQVAEGLNVHLGAARTGWSSFDELVVENKGAPAALATSVETEKWKNVWSYGIGLSYQLNQQWLLRAGIAQDNSPIPNATRTVRVPSDDRMVYAVGASWAPTQQFSADIGYAFLDESKTSVNQTATPLRYSADFENNAHALAIQLNWKI
jgi:long-chain fatty acid transport protein